MTAQVVGCWAATEWMASLPAVETDAAAAPAALAAPAAVRPAAPHSRQLVSRAGVPTPASSSLLAARTSNSVRSHIVRARARARACDRACVRARSLRRQRRLGPKNGETYKSPRPKRRRLLCRGLAKRQQAATQARGREPAERPPAAQPGAGRLSGRATGRGGCAVTCIPWKTGARGPLIKQLLGFPSARKTPVHRPPAVRDSLHPLENGCRRSLIKPAARFSKRP